LGPRFEDQWRTRFEEFAELRDDDAGIAGWSSTGLDARVRRFLRLWKPAAAGRWLDAGCGAGTYTAILRQRGLQVVAVDYSLPTLRKAASRNLDVVGLLAADVRRLPFRNELFDGVICFGVNQALADSRPAVEELSRQVKAGGELWVDALNRWCLANLYASLRRRLRGRPVHLRYESPRRIMRLLRDCGFTDVRLHWMPIIPGRSQRLQQMIESQSGQALLRLLPPLGLLISHSFIVQGRKSRPLTATRSSAAELNELSTTVMPVWDRHPENPSRPAALLMRAVATEDRSV